jgi:flagellar assembly protein FliH
LRVDDVRPYEPANCILNEETVCETPEVASDGHVELESLDLVKLGPYLLLLSARERAEALVKEAQSEADKIHEQSRSQGVARGREEAKQDVMPAAVAFANAGQALIVFEEQMIARYAPEMVRLALEVAEKIVHRTVANDPEIVASVLQRAREEVTDARQIRIRLHPADYDLLAEIRPDLLTSGNASGRTIEVLTDEEVGRGGCRLETEIGVVDATLPTQIDEIHRQLLDQENLSSHADSTPQGILTAAMTRDL